jgi:hypothetical protein
MFPVLDLDPVLRSTSAVATITPLRNQSLKPEFAGLAEQIWADLALLEIAHEDAVRSAGQEPGQIGFAH